MSFNTVLEKVAFQTPNPVKLVNNHILVGGALGAIGGAKLNHSLQKKLNEKVPEHRRGNTTVAAIGGGLLGGWAGAQAGAFTGGLHHKHRYGFAYGAGPKGGHAQHEYFYGGKGPKGSGAAGAAGAASEKFWAKIPEEAHRRLKGLAQHAKRTPGHEGATARVILEREAKKLGVNVNDFYKHANLKTYFTAPEKCAAVDPQQLKERYVRSLAHKVGPVAKATGAAGAVLGGLHGYRSAKKDQEKGKPANVIARTIGHGVAGGAAGYLAVPMGVGIHAARKFHQRGIL